MTRNLLKFLLIVLIVSFIFVLSESEESENFCEKTSSQCESSRKFDYLSGQNVHFTVAENKQVNDQNSTPTPTRKLKILINSPIFGWSHSQFQGALADVLVEAGHEVHLFTYSMNEDIANYTGSKKAHKVISHLRPIGTRNPFEKSNISNLIFRQPRPWFRLNGNNFLTRVFFEACQEIIHNDDLLAYLKAEKYDFGISEPYDACPFGVFKMVGIPSMAISQALPMSISIASFFGIPSFSSFVVDVWIKNPVEPMKMTFIQRSINFVFDLANYLMVRNLAFKLEQPVFDSAFGVNSPSLHDVMRNVSLAFVNANEFFSLPRPISHKVVYVGGIVEKDLTKSVATLPERFQTILDDTTTKGVILFSFGTLVNPNLMKTQILNAFIEAFSKFSNYSFIWKLDISENSTFEVPSNVFIFDWIPQSAILAHPKTKVFISHCGLNSANEAAKFGVPVLAIPLFADQPHNAAVILDKGSGLAFSLSDVELNGALIIERNLRQILENPIFAQNARLVSRKLALTPFSAREKFVKWVEFAAEFSDLNELNMPTDKELGFFAYYSLDVISAILCIFLLLCIVFFYLIRSFCKISLYLFSKNKCL